MGLTIGIDEAGRGPVIGPMVVAAVGLMEKEANALAALGVQDSKAFGSGDKAKNLRAILSQEIQNLATFVEMVCIPPARIDDYVGRGELNLLEREAALALLKSAPSAPRIVADGANVFGPLEAEIAGFQAMNKADSEVVAVAAASIVAKAERDAQMAAIEAKYFAEFGKLTGGGYVNKGSQAFLVAYHTKYARLPDEARKSWPHKYLRN